MTSHSLTITLSSQTLDELKQGGFTLYAFLPVQCSNRTGVPLVWQRIDQYLGRIPVDFPAALSAYASTSTIAPNAAVEPDSVSAVKPGQLVTFSGSAWTLSTAGLAPDVVGIVSAAAQSFGCGLAADQVPFCAFTLLAGALVPITPIKAICLMFATSDYDAGVYMVNALGPTMLVTLADGVERQVAYDVATGWSPTGVDWAMVANAGTSLKDLLLLRPGTNEPSRLVTRFP
ncbi:MAG: hypothetical protein WC729_24825 [Sphingomonas sp.]|jgi:hypothetical protein|uniref:hypothetical protein n=1 Tax=Sphingomonas sp. TaxID=28214 RepID=UPI0035641E3D